MPTGRRRPFERLLPLVLSAAVSAAAQDVSLTDPALPQPGPGAEPGAPRVGSVVAEGALGSVKQLLEIAAPMAKEWSEGAKLYAMYGRAPRNAERWEAAEWGLIFGDPKTKDGSFHIVFADGAIKTRQGIKGGVKMIDIFKEGHFEKRDTGVFLDYTNGDYAHCKPVHAEFVDMKAIEKAIRKRKLVSDSLGQYSFSLLRPLDDQCDGLGRQSLFLRDKPIPAKLHKRSLWTIHTPDEVVYIDARTGKVVHRRPI